MPNDEVAKTVLASAIGLVGWPEQLEHEGRVWVKDNVLSDRTGEIQYVEYFNEEGATSRWLVVVNE